MTVGNQKMRVLVAVKSADYARVITSFISNQVWPSMTEFVIINVVSPPKVGSFFAVLPGPVLDELEMHQFETAKELVRNTAKAIQQGCRTDLTTEVVVEGFAKDDITDYARNNDIDLIVTGAHGRPGTVQPLIGGVSMAVLVDSPCSVILVRPQAATEQFKNKRSHSTRNRKKQLNA